MIIKYTWQCYSDSKDRVCWLEDIHGFGSLEDALDIGLEAHSRCTGHTMHRVICNYINPQTLSVQDRVPVFYVLQNKKES